MSSPIDNGRPRSRLTAFRFERMRHGDTALDIAEKRHEHELADLLAEVANRKSKLGPLAACGVCKRKKS